MKTKHHSILSAPVTQSGDQTQNRSIRPRWFALALGGFLFTSIFALSAPPVEAQCQQWNVGQGWRFKQGSGQGAINVDMNLHQNGTVVTGTASFTGSIKKTEGGLSGSFGETGTIQGDVDGTVKGDHFAVRIHWSNNTTGVYNGTIGPSGRIEGTGYNQATPSIKVHWYSETHMDCADAAPVGPKPIKSSGKMPKSASAAADDWLEQERRKRKTNNTYDANDPNRKGHGFINGLSNPTPTPSAEADESSSDDQHKKNKKKKKHHHHDDDQNQGND